MKNIAFIISNLGPGGAEKVAVNIAKHLRSKDYNIYFFHLCDDEVYFDLSDKNIHLIELNICKFYKNPLKRMLNKVKQIKIVIDALKKYKIDIVMSFITDTNLLSIISAKLLKLPIIACEHSIFDINEKRFVIKIARRLLYPLADYITVLTKEDAKNYYTFIKKNKVIVIPNSIDLSKYQYEYIPIKQREKMILAVGRLNKLKGFDKLIEAFSMIKDKKDYKLVIVGGEANVNKLNLIETIKNFKMEKYVYLAGFRSDVEEFYKKSKIFVLTSEYEAYPNVLLEALSFGCACISFTCPYGPRAIIENGINGILVENQNIVELSKSIEKLINDEELQEFLSKNALEIIKKNDNKKIMLKWEELIESVVNSKKNY